MNLTNLQEKKPIVKYANKRDLQKFMENAHYEKVFPRSQNIFALTLLIFSFYFCRKNLLSQTAQEKEQKQETGTKIYSTSLII